MIREDIKIILDNFRIADAELGSCANDIEDYIDNLLKMVDLGDHYKHLYSEVKKQKDDVVKVLYQLKRSARWERYLYEVDYILRMLGEIDVED